VRADVDGLREGGVWRGIPGVAAAEAIAGS